MDQPTAEQLSERCDRYRKLIDTANDKLNATGLSGGPERIVRVVNLIHGRLLNGLETMERLDRFPKSLLEQAIILRALYDFHLQQLYIQKKLAERIEDFVDFALVEQCEVVEIIKEGKTTNARTLLAKPEYIALTHQLASDLNTIRHKFLVNGKTSFHKNWYKGKMDALAREVNRLDEYRIITRLLNQVVHGSFITVNHKRMYPDEAYLHDTLVITVRVMGGYAGHLGIKFCPEELNVIECANENLY